MLRGKIKQISHENDKKVLVLQKKKKFFKKDGLRKKDKRSLSPYIQGGLHCDCDRINVTLNENYIIMGNNTGPGEFTAMYIAKWRKDKQFRKAIKLMRKKDICSKPLDIGDNGIELPTNGKGDKNKGNKSKGRKKKNKNKKKKGKGKKKKGKKGKKGKNKKNRKKNKKGGKGRKNKKGNKSKNVTTVAPSS